MPGGPGSVWSRTFRLLCSQPAPPYSTCGLSTADPPNEADPPNHLQWDQLPHCASLGALGRESRSTHKCHTGGQQGLPRASLAQVGLLPHTGCSDFSYLRNCTLKLRYRLPVRTHCEGPLDLARGALGKLRYTEDKILPQKPEPGNSSAELLGFGQSPLSPFSDLLLRFRRLLVLIS